MHIITNSAALENMFIAARRGVLGYNLDSALYAAQLSTRSMQTPANLEVLSNWLAALWETNGAVRVDVTARRRAEAVRSFPQTVAGERKFVNVYRRGDTERGEELTFDLTHLGTMEEGPIPTAESNSDIVVTPLDGWGEGYSEIRPTDELLERLPARARAYAVRTIASNGSAGARYVVNEDGMALLDSAGDMPSGEELLTQARNAYRALLRARMANPMEEQRRIEEAAKAEHRKKTASNFEAFVRKRKRDEEQHIMKLPFVPHGLSSSRRWGIEIEHPGARGVEAPAFWDSKGDGSLRSAYDGWVEVQDFEPYDHEVTENIGWHYCNNAERHDPRIEEYDATRGEYIYLPNPDFINPLDCEDCGRVTRTVRVEPQTITHRAQSGDCREFVSPILVSMHSNGLEQLMNDLKGRPTNSSAGVHVHVEADDLSSEQIATIVYGYDILEPILEASYQRDRRDFCERRDVNEVLEAARKAKSKEHFDPYAGGRYRTLNTHALSDHGTLEFRAMGPVYDYDYLVRWAMLLRELVNAVAAGATTKDFAKIKSWDDLVLFIAKFGKEFIRAAVYEMTGETGHAATLEKGREPLTTEALNRDLSELFESSFASVGESMRRLADTVNAAWGRPRELVGVAGDSEI